MSKCVKRRPACPNPSDFNAHDRQLQLAKEGTAFRAWDSSKRWVKNSFESLARVFKSRSMVTIEYVWARKIWRGIELCQPLGHGQLCSVAKICQNIAKEYGRLPTKHEEHRVVFNALSRGVQQWTLAHWNHIPVVALHQWGSGQHLIQFQVLFTLR